MANQVIVEVKIEGVSANLASLSQLTKALNGLSKETDKTKKNLDDAGSGFNKLRNAFNSVGSAVFSLKGVLATAAAALGGFTLTKAIEDATNLENALIGLQAVAANSGQNIDKVKQAAMDLSADGMIPLTSVSNTLKLLLSTGLDLDTAIKLFYSLRDAASFNRQSFYDLGAAIEATTEGIKNGNSTKADAVGITKNLSVMQKEYAASIGKSVNSLTDYEKIQAAVNGFINEGKTFLGDYARSANTFSGLQNQVNSTLSRTSALFGQQITQNTAVVGTYQALTVFLGQLQQSFIENESTIVTVISGIVRALGYLAIWIDVVYRSVKSFSELFMSIGPSLLSLPTMIISGWSQLFESLADGFTGLFGIGKKMNEFFTDIRRGMDKVLAKTQKPFLDAVNTATTITALGQLGLKMNELADNAGKIPPINFITNANAKKKEIEDLKTNIANITKEITKEGQTELQKLNAQYNERLKLLKDGLANNVIAYKEYQQLVTNLTSTYNQKRAELIKKDLGELPNKLKDIQNQIDLVGTPDLVKLKNKLDDQNRVIQESLRKKLIDATKAAEMRAAIEGDYYIKSKELQEKEDKEYWDNWKKEIDQATDKPFKIFFESETKNLATSLLGSAKGFLSVVKKGSLGLLQSVSSSIGAAFGPFGEMIADLFNGFLEIFTQAPEQFSEMFINLIADLPKMLGNVFINFANLIGGPIAMEMIKGFINNIPYLVRSLTYSLVTLMSSPAFWASIAFAAVEALIEAIPAAVSAFGRGIGDSFKNLFSTDLFSEAGKKIFYGFRDLMEKFNPVNLLTKMFKFDGGGKGVVESFIGLDFPFVKFAKGGLVGGSARVNGDSPMNDIVPALLSPGEIVIPRSIVSKGMQGIIDFVKQLGSTGLKQAQVGSDKTKEIVNALMKLGIEPERRWGFSVGPISVGSGGVSVNTDPTTWTIGSSGAGILGDAINTFGKPFNELTEALQKQLLPSWLRDIIDSLKRIGIPYNIPKLVTDPKGYIKEIVKAATTGVLRPPLTKMAKPPQLRYGGKIPNGYNENFPALMSSGENVLDRSTNEKLEKFLTSQSNELLPILLSKVINLLESPMTINSDIKVNEKTFADLILQLNRTNSRVAV